MKRFRLIAALAILGCGQPDADRPALLVFSADTTILRGAEPIGLINDGVMCGGTLFIADRIQGNVKAVGRAGEYRQIGRSGDGPGEFGSPFELACDERTQELLVIDVPEMSLERFDSAGGWIRSRLLPGTSPGGLAVLPSGDLFVAFSRVLDDGTVRSIHVLSGDSISSRWEKPRETMPLSGSFSTVHADAIGDHVLLVQGHGNSARLLNLQSMDSIRFPVLEDVYVPPAWPSVSPRDLTEVDAWMKEQMWMTNVEAAGDVFIVEMLAFDTAGDHEIYYSVIDTTGREIASAGPTSFRYLARDGDELLFGRVGEVDSYLMRARVDW